MDITDGVFRSTYTTPTFVQPLHIPPTSGDTLLELYSPGGRFTVTLGDLHFPSAVRVVIRGGLPLVYTGLPICEPEHDYTKVYAVYEAYSERLQKKLSSVNIIVDGVVYEASNGTLRKV